MTWFGRRPKSAKPRITLLIPTFNRSSYLNRQLDFLERFDRSFYRILILDGSDDPDQRSKARALASGSDVDYAWYDSQSVSSYDRVLDGIERSDTDYVQVVPDDDYFSDSALRRHVQILDESPDAVGAFGHSIGFLRTRGQESEGFIRIDVAEYRNKPDYVFDHPLVRLHYALLEKSRSSYYCVYRSEVARRMYMASRRFAELDQGEGHQIDPRAYYFGDLLVTALPVLMGKKVNSGLPAVACELGQSFDMNVQPGSSVPPRQKHYLLPLDEEFRFRERVQLFVDGVVSVYKSCHECPDEDALRDFLASLTMVAIGSTAFTGDWISRFNKLVGVFSVGSESVVRTFAGITKEHQLTAQGSDDGCGVCSSEGHDVCGRTREDYSFALDHLLEHHGIAQWRILEFGSVELEFARTMFSFERPWPYAVRGKG